MWPKRVGGTPHEKTYGDKSRSGLASRIREAGCFLPRLPRSLSEHPVGFRKKRWTASALRLQRRSQPGCATPRSGDFSACPIAEPYAVETVTVVSNPFDGLQVNYGMPSDLDKRIAT